MSQFSIQTEKFKGPIELLLDLVEKRKMHVSDVSLAEVADRFIEYVEKLEDLPVADTANFIYVASILLLIKSKSLLPGLELTSEEEGSIEDLEKRIALFKVLKDQTTAINEIYGKHVIFFAEEREPTVVFAPPKSLSQSKLAEAIKSVLQALPKVEVLEKRIVEKVVSLEEMIDNLAERMQTTLKTSFRQFTKMDKAEKVNTIVSFLAMLELVKRGVINVVQQGHFSDIEMEVTNPSTPKYN